VNSTSGPLSGHFRAARFRLSGIVEAPAFPCRGLFARRLVKNRKHQATERVADFIPQNLLWSAGEEFFKNLLDIRQGNRRKKLSFMSGVNFQSGGKPHEHQNSQHDCYFDRSPLQSGLCTPSTSCALADLSEASASCRGISAVPSQRELYLIVVHGWLSIADGLPRLGLVGQNTGSR
jgi:hypothetical protein